jgi:four helix bundle protein
MYYLLMVQPIKQKHYFMNSTKSHRDLDVWKTSMDFVLDLYKITETFPIAEKFGLVAQMQRAAVSICSNIAEGAGRFHPKEYVQFLYISMGSVSELETQLEISFRLGYVKSIEIERETLNRIRKMLIGLIKHIQSRT